jgi:hypothetical protein
MFHTTATTAVIPRHRFIPRAIPGKRAEVMRVYSRFGHIVLALVLLGGWANPTRADIITSFTAGINSANSTNFFGQEVTTPSGGPWNNLTFNYFSDVPATTPSALGHVFLLTQAYTGTPQGLSSATPGFVAESTGVVANQYVFASGVTIQPNTAYYFYNDSTPPVSGASGLNNPGFSTFFATTASSNFGGVSIGETNFTLAGTQVSTSPVPAPPAVVLVGLGAGCVALRRYFGRRATV